MEQRVGTCSLCGGSVRGYRGAWFGVQMPPPDKCSACGAVAAGDVIQMIRPQTRFMDPLWEFGQKLYDVAHKPRGVKFIT